MFAIVESSISLDDLAASVADQAAGAIATFLGMTRATNRGRKVLKLEYEAYADMAVAQLEKIADEAAQRWTITRVSIVHRIGVVPVGEVSVAIAVSAPHRGEAIAACHYAIDRLKQMVPIWKKEHFEGGEVWIGSMSERDHERRGDAAKTDESC